MSALPAVLAESIRTRLLVLPKLVAPIQIYVKNSTRYAIHGEGLGSLPRRAVVDILVLW